MPKKKRPNQWWVRERIARNTLAMAAKREAARRKAVYGPSTVPPDAPSESVRAVSTGVESSRRRH
ncbi:hypothetical protein [Streptomyces sp. SAJ15]|uniref:hypothetical protein n=1 Tax=Streptomyces sp. SAJ15 TaxID=2011095 RepID=UPI001184B9C4|nr:hypothetical protein [Streptomyces sp. SAJ15]